MMSVEIRLPPVGLAESEILILADLYARDRAAFTAAGADLAKAQAELAAAEGDWLRLELLREEIEGT